MLDFLSPIDQAFVNVSIRYALFIGITLILLPLIPALSNRFRALLWAFSLFSFMLFCSLSILGTSLVWKVLPQKPSELSIPIKADPIPEQTRLKEPVATTPLPIQTKPLSPEENSYNGFGRLFLLGSLSIGSYWLLGQFRLKKLLSTALLLEKDHPLVKRLQLHSGGKAIFLYLSPSTQIPFACGMIRPRIVLPTNVDQWSQDRLDMVLRHEYAHIANWDLLLANLARITLVAQWFNPLVWLIYKSFLKNAEKACDDQVLDSGTEPTEYARCLVDFAKAHPLPKLLHAIQFSITKTKKNMITTRIQNILKRKCDRKPIGFLKLTPALIIMACFGLPISIVELRADTPTENSISSKKDSEITPLKYDIAFHRKFIFEDTIWVIYEGINEARSIGSCTIKVYKNYDDRFIDDLITGLVFPRDGGIENVWISDFNNNGDLEIIVNTRNAGSGGSGNIDRYELSNNQLIEKPIELTKHTGYGYMGKDRFSIKNGKLNREFPLYNEGDSMFRPTGGRKILDYDLKKEKWIEAIPGVDAPS